jgi:hypothetical protein
VGVEQLRLGRLAEPPADQLALEVGWVASGCDLLLTHDALASVVFDRHRRGLNWASEAARLDDLVRGVRPRVCFFGHHHTRLDSQIVPIII